MKFGVYSMRDNVSGLYNNPTFENDDNCAKRSFKYAVNNNDFLSYNYTDVDLFAQLSSFSKVGLLYKPLTLSLIE